MLIHPLFWLITEKAISVFCCGCVSAVPSKEQKRSHLGSQERWIDVPFTKYHNIARQADSFLISSFLMRLASQLLYPTLLARADVETFGGAEVDGTVGARRRQRGFRHRRGSFLSRWSWRGRRRQRRRRHTLQRHFTTTFIGDVDSVGT